MRRAARNEAAERLDFAVRCIRDRAWESAREHIATYRRWGAADAYPERTYAHGLLSALFFLAGPGGEQLDLDSLIGARAWADGESAAGSTP